MTRHFVSRRYGLAFVLPVVTSLSGVSSMAAEGLITIKSSFGQAETVERLVAEVKKKA